MSKKDFLQRVLTLNPSMRQVGTSDVWMGTPQIVDGKLVNMTITLPDGAKLDGHSIVLDGMRIHVYQP